MDQTFTPRRKRKSKSQGDLHGSGKKQQSILTYLSPSSSINITPGSSYSSSLSRTNMSDSNEVTSVSSKQRRKRSKEKLLSKKVPSKRRLSLVDISSDEEQPVCGKDQTKGNVFKDSIAVSNESCFENVRRNLFQPDKSISQTVIIISSGEDSDFELHTSKKSYEFSSQFQRSHCTINQDDERPISTQNLELLEVNSSSKKKRRGTFSTSTPKNECVLTENELSDPGVTQFLVKGEETEINTIQGDAVGRKSNLAIEDVSCLYVFNAQKPNQKRFHSKLQSSKISSFVDSSSSSDRSITSSEELRNIALKTTAEIDCTSDPHQFVCRESSQNCEGQSTIQDYCAPNFSNIDQPSVIRGFTHGTVESETRFLNSEQPVSDKIDESDYIKKLQDETMDGSINEERNLIVSSSDFSRSTNDVEQTRLGCNEESSSLASTISPGSILEKSSNGRISDSEDSQFEEHESRMIDGSIEVSFEILPPTPEVNHESFNACENMTTESVLELVEDTYDQATNLICSNETESLLESNNNAHANYDPEDETNLVGRSKSSNSEQKISLPVSDEQGKSGEDETNLVGRQKSSNFDEQLSSSISDEHGMSGESTCSIESKEVRKYPEGEVLGSPSLSSSENDKEGKSGEDETNLVGRQKSSNSDEQLSSSISDEHGMSGESTCSIESKEVFTNSAVGINNEQPLQFDETSNKDTSTEKSYENGSLPNGVLPTKVNPRITKIDVKGIELNSKISCGVTSAPNLKDMLNSTNLLPSSFETSTDRSHNSMKPHTEIMLLDAVISECRKFAAFAFDRKPLCTFLSLYSSLEYEEKIAFHSFLFNSLADEDRWQRCPDDPYIRKHMDRLAAINLVNYIDGHEDSLKLIDEFNNMEIISIYLSLGIKISIDDVDMREALILACKDDTKFGSADKTKQAIKAMACHNFAKIEHQTISCVKMCLELVSMCLHLSDKIYKSVAIGKYFDELLRKCSRNGIQLLPLQMYTSLNLINSEKEYLEFVNYCEEKAAFESGRFEDHHWSQLVTHMAMLDFNVEQNVMLKNSPLFRLIYTNMVYILDNELEHKVFTTNGEDFDYHVVLGLGILLKQEFTGFGLKGVWSKRKFKYLLKHFNIRNPDVLSDILQQNVSVVENITRSEFVSGLLENAHFRFSPEEKSVLYQYLRAQCHKKVSIENIFVAGTVNSYKILRDGRKLSLKKKCLFEHYGRDFKHGVIDFGLLLLNLVFLVFWPVIYTRLENEFVSRYQKCPLDWGSKCFYSKREKQIHTRIASIHRLGIQGLIGEMDGLIENRRGYHSIMDWAVVSTTSQEMYSILEILGLVRFSQIADYLFQHVEERQIGLPDLVVWNDSPPRIKFVALKKRPNDPLHPHQIIWLEKLLEFGVDAEECHIIPKSTKLQTSVLPLQPIDLNNTMLLT